MRRTVIQDRRVSGRSRARWRPTRLAILIAWGWLAAGCGGDQVADPIPPESEIGPPSALRFSVEPDGASGGTPFRRQPVVEVVDRRGNRVVSAEVTVTIDFGANPTGATLTGTTSVAAVNGLARFSDLAVDSAAGGYTLVATAPGLTEAASDEFEVVVGPAARLAFVREPGGAVAARPFVFQPEVEILDAGGNRVLSSTLTVVLVIGENPGGGTLSGTPEAAAVEGLARFGDLRIDKAGMGYTLTATAAELSATSSATFNVAVGPPRDLSFVTHPAGAFGGTPFETQPTVEVLDAGGNRVTSAMMPVTIAIQANPARGTLSGTTTIEAVDGLVSFTDLSIDVAGEGYSLIASSEGLRNGRSNEFDVLVGPPARLAFITQPGGAAGGTPFSRQPVVEVLDAGGNRVTTGAEQVTASIDANPADGTLSGTSTVTSAEGVASFTDLSIDRASAGYRLAMTAGALETAVSEAFEVVVGPAAQLNFVVEPDGAAESVPFTSQPVVEILDAGGNRVTTAVGNVNLAIGANPGGGALSGTSSIRPEDGVATFTNLRISQAAPGYTLAATSGTLPARSSAAFDVRVTYTAVSSGGEHTCALSVTGAAYCWGLNADGQLGDGTTVDAAVPTVVAGERVFTTISAGRSHSCAVTTARSAFCWGQGEAGQLGDGLMASSATPVAVAGGLSITSASAGDAHSCGVTTGFTAYCWGANPSGQIGDGTLIERMTPTVVTRSGGATLVTAGADHSCGLIPQPGAGAVDASCWGANDAGQLGDGSTDDATTPVSVAGAPGLILLEAGTEHGCGITSENALLCWGANAFGQLGHGGPEAKTTPTAVAGALSFQRVSAGEVHTCGVATDGRGYCWGGNTSGQLGDGGVSDQMSPVPVQGGLSFQRISAAGSHSCGLTAEGTVYCWGANSRGQLGDGSTAPSSVPVRIAAPWE